MKVAEAKVAEMVPEAGMVTVVRAMEVAGKVEATGSVVVPKGVGGLAVEMMAGPEVA